MIYRVILIAVTLFVVRTAEAVMVLVKGIERDATLVVERNGSPERIRLAGVLVTDEAGASELLRWTVDGAWVKIEPSPEGGHLVWRSPDALFVNREMVLRGFATATLPGIRPEPRPIVTYLGVIDPPAPAAAAKPAPQPKVNRAPAPKTSSGTSRRPPKTPSPRARPKTVPKGG